MSALLRLYPKAWRERYAEEFAGLAEERPLTVRDRVDLVRGAWDAWRDPSMTPAAALAGGGTLVDVQPRRARTGTGRLAAPLSLVAAAMFGLTIVSFEVSWWFPHLEWRLSNALLAAATSILGLAVWAIAPVLLARLAALVLVAGGIVVLRWDSSLAAMIPLTIAGVMLAASRVVHGRPSTVAALLAGGLSVAFWIAPLFRPGDGTVVDAVVATFISVPIALAVEARPGRREVMTAAMATVLGVVGVYVGATAMSPMLLHDGYGLWCGGMTTDTCVAKADAFVATIRAAEPRAAIQTVWVDPYRPAWGCAHSAGEMAPCWFGPDPWDREPLRRSIAGTDQEPGVQP